MEAPLRGEASYDVLVGSYGNALAAGTHLPAANPPACHAAYEWAAAQDRRRGVDLFFELDADAPAGQHAGIHCRHGGDVDAALDFYEAIGESWRAPLYRAAVDRLPVGWKPFFAAVFPGRPGTPTRLELTLSDEEDWDVTES